MIVPFIRDDADLLRREERTLRSQIEAFSAADRLHERAAPRHEHPASLSAGGQARDL